MNASNEEGNVRGVFMDDCLSSDDDSDCDREKEEENFEEEIGKDEDFFGRNLHRATKRDRRIWNNKRTRASGGGARGVLCGLINNSTDSSNAQVIDVREQVQGLNFGQIGPELENLRKEQGLNREYYTKEHFDRLYGRARKWDRDQRQNKVWCKDIHRPGEQCDLCSSCHFCRQKSSDRKTSCQCATWEKAPEGGRGRGQWCGWCLEMRMGENIEEAIADEEWRCPVCRDICNCSGANCLRHKRNLFPTQQLTREAEQYGWQSVAHYLITTALVTGKDAPPMLDLPAAYVRRRLPKNNISNVMKNSNNNNASEASTHLKSNGSNRNKEELEREREASALRREIEMKVRMAFGAVNEEDEDEDEEDMNNNNNDRTAVRNALLPGDDDDASRRKALTTARTTTTTHKRSSKNYTSFADDDLEQDNDIIDEIDEEDARERNLPKKSNTIGNMFKRFADKNSGAFLFAASSDDESELESSDGEFDDELLLQQQRERRERHEMNIKNRAQQQQQQQQQATKTAAALEVDGDKDDDVIIVNNNDDQYYGDKEPNMIVRANAREVPYTQQLHLQHKTQNRARNLVGEETADVMMEDEEMGFFQRRRERRKRRRVIHTVARARYVNGSVSGGGMRALPPILSQGHAILPAAATTTVDDINNEKHSAALPPPVPMQQQREQQHVYINELPTEEVEAAMSELRREDETQAEIAAAQEAEEEQRVLNATSTTGDGEVVKILREFIEFTSPSNEIFQKRNIDEASFDLFMNTIASTLERAELLLFTSVESELRAFYALCLRANKFAPYLKQRKVSSMQVRIKIADFINDEAKFQLFDVTQRATCLRASLRLIERYWSGKDLDVFKVSDEDIIATADEEIITDSEGNLIRCIEKTTSEFLKARANYALEKCLRLVSVCSKEFALAKIRENWMASRKLLNPALMEDRDLIAPAVTVNCQKRIDTSIEKIDAEYEAERVRRNESVIVGLSDSSQEGDEDAAPSALVADPPVADDTVHLQRRSSEVEMATMKILIETTESTHVLLLAALSVLRVVAKGLAFTPAHGAFLRSKMLSESIGKLVAPKLPFRPKIRKCALGLISACVSRGERDWLESRSEENKMVAEASARFCWPQVADLLRENEDEYENAETINDKSGGYSSAVNRAATETAARMLNLLVKSGVWPWGKAELAISHPFSPKDFWKLANPRKRAKAFRLYARLVDSTPVLRGGIGAPLLKLWALCAMDVAASEKGERRQNTLLRANGLHRARARLARACARHPRLFDAFSSSNMLKREAMDARNTAGVLKRSSWVIESLVRCCEVGNNPVATVSAINALQEVYDKRVQECSGRNLGNKSRSFRIGFKAVMAASYSRNTDMKMFGLEPRVQVLRTALDTFISIIFDESDPLQVDTIQEALINSAKSLAIFFNLENIACCSLLKQLCYACVERKHAKKATRIKFSHGFFSSLYDASYIADNNEIVRKSRECMRSTVLIGVLGSCVASARNLATVPSANSACENWVLAFETAMEASSLSSSSNDADDGATSFLFSSSADDDMNASTTLLGQMCVFFLDAILPPVCAIGRGAAPPPVAVADLRVRSMCLNALILLFENKKTPLFFANSDAYAKAPVWAKQFSTACMKVCVGEVAASLGGCKDFSASRLKNIVATPMTKVHCDTIRREMLASINSNLSASFRVLEEAKRTFRKPSENPSLIQGKDGVDEDAILHPSICAMKFLTRFTKISKFCAMEVATKVIPAIEGSFKHGESFPKRELEIPLRTLRDAILLMTTGGERGGVKIKIEKFMNNDKKNDVIDMDADDDLAERRKRQHYDQNNENADPLFGEKKVKREEKENGEEENEGEEEEEEKKAHQVSPWYTRCDRALLYSSNRTDFSTIASLTSDDAFTIVGKLHSREPKVGVTSKTNPKTNRTFEMLFCTLEDENGLKVRAQLVGKSAKQLADALDERKKKEIEIIELAGVTMQKKAEIKPGLVGMVWDSKGTATCSVVQSFD